MTKRTNNSGVWRLVGRRVFVGPLHGVATIVACHRWVLHQRCSMIHVVSRRPVVARRVVIVVLVGHIIFQFELSCKIIFEL